MVGTKNSGTRILSIEEHEKRRRLAPLKTVEAYWHALREHNQIPARSQVDPRGIESVLENAFLAERIAPTLAKLRVAGSHVSDLMGMDMAGMPLSSLIVPEDRKTFGTAVSRMFAEPGIVEMSLSASTGFGKPKLTAHLVMLPLRSDFDEVNRCLGALVSHGQIGRAPRRFSVDSVSVVDVNEAVAPTYVPRSLPALRHTPKGDLTPADGLQEEPRGFEAKSASQHLKLVISND